MKYDYFVAGRWRNHENITPVAHKIRSAGKTAYYWVENEYDGYGIHQNLSSDEVDRLMTEEENMDDWQNDPLLREIFERDMQALRNSEAIAVVFPIGFSAHMELGAAYGMGKKCYGIGQPEKAETLYFMFDNIFLTVEDFMKSELFK